MGRLIATVLMFLALAPAVRAQRPAVPAQGTQVFANILHELQLKPVRRIADLNRLDPQQTIVIAFGPLDRLPEVEDNLGGLSHFLKRGGALLVASDYPHTGRLWTSLQLGIEGSAVEQEAARAYKGTYEHCPILEILDRDHPLTTDLRKPLVTLRPSYFALRAGRDLVGLAGFGLGSRVAEEDLWPVGHLLIPPYVVSSPKDAPPVGRVVALAGHGVFMNCLLMQTDNSNFEFAVNVVRWLREGPAGPRRHVFLLEQSTPVGKFQLPLTAPTPPLPALLPLLNAVLNDVQQRGLLERFLDENIDPDLLRRGLLFALTALLVPFAARRLWHTFFRRDHRAALVVGLQDPPLPGPPAALQRHQELLTRGNLWEPAHTLVRRWFQEQAGLSPTHWPSEEVPAFHIDGGWWRRWRLGRQVRRLYRLAAANHSWPVSRHGFRSLVAQLGQLTNASQRGELRWVKETIPS